MYMHGFGKRLKRLLEEKGINQDELAKRLKVTKGFVSLILNDKRNVSLTTLYEIARALKCDPKELL